MGAAHFEPFVHLVDVTSHSALVAWGGFYLRDTGDGWVVVDDDDLPAERGPGGTIGAGSAPYGRATVEVLDERGTKVVASASTAERNHAWVEGLAPDTAYRYRVVVGGEPWASGERWDWAPGAPGPAPAGRRYDLRLRTHPAEDDPVPVTFLAVGDYGVGITNGESGRRQHDVAGVMEHLAASHPVRFVVSLGDNIYHGPEDRLAQSGDEDDDWYFTFYQPYRDLIDHLPVYPTAGNHDGSDDEASDDRDQLADNFHLDERFGAAEDVGRASLDPGLFYCLRVGALVELVSVDTSWGERHGVHHFDHDGHRRWLEGVFGDGGGGGRWRIPFSHHPAWCAGPHHRGMSEQVARLVPLYRRGGVRLVLSGHEHNFQHGQAEGLDYVISGAGGKLQGDPPREWDEAGTVAWAREGHCLLVEVGDEEILVTPYGVGPDGAPRPLQVRAPDGSPVEPAFAVRRSP
jgi:tartrate-resistant acid phosphatase type 5